MQAGPAPTQNLRDSPQRWWLLALLTAAMFFCYAHRSALSVATPFLMKDLGLTTASMGVVLSAFFWSYSIFQIPSGWVTDRFGVAWSYGIGFALWSVAAALTGFSVSLWTLIGFRVLLGIGQAIAFPATSRAVANWFPDRDRGMVTGVYLSGVRLGQATVSAIGGFVLASWGWRNFFFVVGLVALVWVIPWIKFVQPWEGKRELPKTTVGQTFVNIFSLMGERRIIGIFLGFFAYDYVWFLFLTWLPGYLTIERKFTPQEMGVYNALPIMTMFVAILLAGIVSDWLIRRGHREVYVRKSMITVGFVISLAMVPAALVENNMTAVWLLVLSIWGLGLVAPNAWTLTQAVCEKQIIGTASGIQNFGGNIGGVIAPMLTGFIAHQTNSFVIPFCIAGAISVAGILCYWFIVPNESAEAKERIQSAA
jgi:MFS transporter, ACS family, D-galactonate transporter